MPETRTAPADRVYNVLFLCTGNSARSIMAECILNDLGRGWFHAYSAGSHPTGHVNPHALALLRRFNYPTGGLRSKSWSEFATPDASEMDFVFTVCDNAAGEICPVWPGQPIVAHWPFADPAKAEGSEAEIGAVFAEVYRQLHTRTGIFVNLPIASLDRLAIKRRLEEMGRPQRAPA